jgi:hypothetical protein
VRSESAVYTEVRERLEALDERWQAQRTKLLRNPHVTSSRSHRVSAVVILIGLLGLALVNLLIPVPNERSYQLVFSVVMMLMAFGASSYPRAQAGSHRLRMPVRRGSAGSAPGRHPEV